MVSMQPNGQNAWYKGAPDVYLFPKQPFLNGAKPHRPPVRVDFVFVLGLAVLLIGISVSIGVHSYRVWYEEAVEVRRDELDQKGELIDMELIAHLERASQRMRLAEGVFRGHNALSPAFDILERMTSVNVRFGTLNYDTRQTTTVLRAAGTAPGYASLYAQGEAIARDPGVESTKIEKSNLNLATGNVDFDIEIVMKGDTLGYLPYFERLQEKNSSAQELNPPPPATSTPPLP